MKREILVRLDITGATDTECGECAAGLDGNCPWSTALGDSLPSIPRAKECIAAENAARESEGTK